MTWPDWDFNTATERERLKVYVKTLMRRLWAACKVANKFVQSEPGWQEQDESPELEVYRTYTPLNPEAKENQWVVNMAFVNQGTPDIH